MREITIRAQPPARLFLSGRLTDAAGNPQGGETIGTISPARGDVATKALTGDDGRFRIESPASRGARVTLCLVGSARALLEEPYVTVAADPEIPIELRAAPAPHARVHGRILGGQGEPIPLLPIELYEQRTNSMPPWSPIGWSATDRSGRFEFARLRPTTGRLRVRFSGFLGTGSSEPFVLNLYDDSGDLEIRAVAPPRIEGIVRGADGAPLPGARVWLRSDHERAEFADGSIIEVLTDRSGRYRHCGVCAGDYWLELLTEGTMPRTRPKPVVVRPGETVRRDL